MNNPVPSGNSAPSTHPAVWRWGVGVLGIAAIVGLGLKILHTPTQETLESCLKVSLAAKLGSVDKKLLEAAVQVASDRNADIKISNDNSMTYEAKAVSERNTWEAIAACRARFVRDVDALRPPRYEVNARVVEKHGSHRLAVADARIYVKTIGLYCDTNRDGACTLKFFDVTPHDRFELVAISSNRLEGPPYAGTLDELVMNGAELESAHSYPTLTVGITDCKTQRSLASRASVTANATQGQIWNGCKPTPPTKGECLVAELQDDTGGRVSYLYDDESPLELQLVVEPRGRPAQALPIGLVTGNLVQVEYTKDCAAHVAAAPVLQVPACSADTQGRIRNAALLPGVTGQVSVHVSGAGVLEVLEGPALLRQRLNGQKVGEQRACVSTFTL